MGTINGWFKSSQNPASLVVRAPLYVHSQHFIRRYNSSAKCQGDESCQLCELKRPRHTIGLVVVSLEGSDAAALLRLTATQHQLHQAWEAMGTNLQGLKILAEHRNGRILGAKATGRTVTSLIPAENYCSAIGQKLYDRVIRELILGMNLDDELTG